MGRFMPWMVSLLLIGSGILFGSFSENRYDGRTSWGYALMGMTCLLSGTGFAFAIWHRDSSHPKARNKYPLE